MNDKVEDFAIGFGCYLAVKAVLLTYPAFVVSYLCSMAMGAEAGFVIWALGSVVWFLMLNSGYFKLAIAVAVITLPFFIGIVCYLFGG